jgi:molybdenum cofactor cytidylyltransferase
MISLVILAAGKSTRMKENKLLLKINGETLIRHIVRTAIGSKADEVIVVVGYEADKIREQLTRLQCKLVVNEHFEKGQSQSVKAGLAAVSGSAEAVMVLPADVALINEQSINEVIDEYRKSKSRIVIASHRNQSGHPILLDRTIFGEISEIAENTLGLKAVINRHRAEVKHVDVDSDRVLIDIDTREEFDKYFRKSATI